MRNPVTAHRALTRPSGSLPTAPTAPAAPGAPVGQVVSRVARTVVGVALGTLLLTGCGGPASPQGTFRYYTRPSVLPPACRPLADVVRLPVEPRLVHDVFVHDQTGERRRQSVLQLLTSPVTARRTVVTELSRAGFSEVRRDGDSTWYHRPATTRRHSRIRAEDVGVGFLPLPGRRPGDLVTGLLRLDVPGWTYRPVAGCPRPLPPGRPA